MSGESVRLLTTLDSVWSAIRVAHPDVPPVVLLTAPSDRSQRKIGHFWALKWQHRTAGNLHEVVLVAEYLNRTANDVLEVLLHEAAHACNFVRGIKDCSANQYHNRAFRKTAEELGLHVEQRSHYGFAHTSLTTETVKRWAEQIELLGREIQVSRRWKRRRELSVQTPNSRNLRASCACGFLIRVSRSTLSQTEIQCGRCRKAFVEG
jgi:hypothetical protein